jgi:hypothetical protein
MKSNSFLIVVGLLLVLVMLFTGCTRVLIDTGDGTPGNRTYDFTDFTSVEVGYAMKLEVIPANTYKITIKGSESSLKHVTVEKKGDKLKIGMDRLFLSFINSPEVTITMPELLGLYLSGASEGKATGFKTSHDFTLTLSGGSSLEMDIETGDFKSELSGASELDGRLVVEDADFKMSGASKVTLEGSANSIRIDGSGASEAIMPLFTVNHADIELSGGSEAELTVNGRLDVNLSGASEVIYGGDTTLGNYNLSGSSNLERRDN